MTSHLSGSHQKTFERLFQHPAPHNLQWREVCSMFAAMPDTESSEDEHGNLKVIRNTHSETFHRPRGKDFDDSVELMKMRHFLDKSGTPVAPAQAPGTHLLVVIDHREARIYSTEMHGAVPHKVVPYDPFGFGRTLHYNEDDADGHRKPELRSFYEAIAKTLRGAKQILMFGTGTGASSAMEALIIDLKKHHHDLAGLIVGSFAIDEHHMTEDQLLAKARELFVAAK